MVDLVESMDGHFVSKDKERTGSALTELHKVDVLNDNLANRLVRAALQDYFERHPELTEQEQEHIKAKSAAQCFIIDNTPKEQWKAAAMETIWRAAEDLAQYPEDQWLDRLPTLPPEHKSEEHFVSKDKERTGSAITELHKVALHAYFEKHPELTEQEREHIKAKSAAQCFIKDNTPKEQWRAADAETIWRAAEDLAQYPEDQWLDRLPTLPPAHKSEEHFISKDEEGQPGSKYPERSKTEQYLAKGIAKLNDLFEDNRSDPPKLNEERAKWAEAKIQKSKSPDKGHHR